MDRAGHDQPADRLPPAVMEALARRGGIRSYPAHAILVDEGDSTDSLYLVLEGRLKVYTSSEDGREAVLRELGPGDFFGVLALDGGRRSASVATLKATRCCVVPGSEVRQLLSDLPDLAMYLIRHLSGMARRLTDQVRGLALQDVYGRLTRLLIEASEPQGATRLLRHPMTQTDIAERIGASREMVGRILKELSSGGYIGQRDRRIEILKKLPLGR